MAKKIHKMRKLAHIDEDPSLTYVQRDSGESEDDDSEEIEGTLHSARAESIFTGITLVDPRLQGPISDIPLIAVSRLVGMFSWTSAH